MYIIGPADPVELDTFFEPMIAELLQLHQGVPTYDAHQKKEFILRAHLILVTGDTPALSKVLHLTGHNDYSPCRFCNLKGTPYQISYKRKGTERYKTQYYYSLTPPHHTPLSASR